MQPSEPLLREYITAPVNVLAVTDQDTERSALSSLTANTQWRFHGATSISTAMQTIVTSNIGVVITNHELPDGTWVDFLECLRSRRNAPRLIVYSRSADTRFWAEVLSMGGYDVLATPFDREEVLRAGYIGWLSWSRASRLTPSVEPHRSAFGMPIALSGRAKAG
jgi:DNA-binding NtrC family response regulator